MKPNLFLRRGSRSSRSSRGRSRSGFWLALFLHFAAATAARSFVTTTAARATAALMATTTAAFATAAALATAAHRETTAATATAARENAAEAATERTTVATTARLTAAAAGRSTAATTTAAAVASENESIGGARNGQHGHDQSETMKVHLTHLHLRTRLQATDVRRLANPGSTACWTNVGRDTCAGKSVGVVAPMMRPGGKIPVIPAE